MTAPPLKQEADRWQELRRRLLSSMPELEEDPEALMDTLEGLSDLKEQLAEVIRSARRDEAFVDGIDKYIKQLTERKEQIKRRADKKKAVAQHYMEDSGIRKIEAPDMTASIRRTAPSVTIYAEDVLPEEFWRVKREPDKSGIKQALKDGKEVPGAQLGNPGETLSIRI